MSQSYNDNLVQVLALTEQMLSLAERGDQDRNDASCGILYGILRDSAYRLKRLAELECTSHREQGKWDIDVNVDASS